MKAKNCINANRQIIGLLLLIIVWVIAASGCHKNTGNSRSVFDPSTPQEDSLAQVQKEKAKMGKKVGVIIEDDSAQLTVPAEEMIPNFMREFGDGTVVTRIIIGSVRRDTTQAPRFYLVGEGQMSGQFRIMAFELFPYKDGELYINKISERHTCAANRCKFCYFTYTGNKIIGCDCNDELKNLRCTHTKTEKNNFYK